MKVLIFRTLAASFLGLAFAVVAIAQEGKNNVFTIDGLKSVIPAEWKEEAPSLKMRYAQFVLPKVEGDAKDGEIVIFKGLGGSGKANIDRWKEQFSTNDGGKLSEKDFKITEIKVAGKPTMYVDMKGTYKYKAAPFDPNSKTVLMENARMLAAQVDANDIYHIKLTGPAKTVEKYRDGFEKWLANFK
jgi:hypothetical protein